MPGVAAVDITDGAASGSLSAAAALFGAVCAGNVNLVGGLGARLPRPPRLLHQTLDNRLGDVAEGLLHADALFRRRLKVVNAVLLRKRLGLGTRDGLARRGARVENGGRER